ncbi:mitochondrial import inner membrane translocase subunit TIM50 [Nematocida sp. AWRm80]|nr:mitochondrial import inner membrane translocase subunit TIM50 [Nematocida sp. AWRm80]
MGLLRTYLNSVPVLGRFTKIAYGSTTGFPGTLIGVGTILFGAIALKKTRYNHVVNQIYRIGFKDNIIDPLPPLIEKKNTVFIDLEEVLLNKTWSFSDLGYKYTIRKDSHPFLFHLSNKYEVVSLSSLPPEISNQMISEVDPYGCIKYRMYIPYKNSFKIEQTNRDPKYSIRIRNTTNSPNDLSVGLFNSNDSLLMTLYDFLNNLQSLEQTDFRKVISSYKNKSFFSEYSQIQNVLYPPKRKYLIFTPTTNPEPNKLAARRINEYLEAKAYIDRHIQFKAPNAK